jgi:hypothetical protein
LQVLKLQRSFDALTDSLNKIKAEEMKEKRKLEMVFDKKRQQQVIARRSLLRKLKGFWPAVFMKITSDDNCPLRLQGSFRDFPVIQHITDYVYATPCVITVFLY